VICRVPSERVIVASLEAVSPAPAVGLPVVRKGGHLVTHAPVHALCMPTSAVNRYRVRPFELTRIEPRLLLETSTVAEAPLEVSASPRSRHYRRHRTPRRTGR
jgi:hypothetical protein